MKRWHPPRPLSRTAETGLNTVLTGEPSQQTWVFDETLTAESLVLRYYPDILRLTTSLIGQPAEAEDAAQETFIHAASRLKDFRGEAKVKTWLYSIAINLCRTHFRKAARRKRVLETLKAFHVFRASTPTPEEAVLKNETRDQLWRAVNTLDEKHRLPILLHYIHEFTAPEIAEILAIQEGTIYSRLHHARKKLHGLIQRQNSR